MKSRLKDHFRHPTYLRNNYSKLHNLTQESMSVEEYTSEFEKLLIKCDLQEAEEQTIVSYLGGLEPSVTDRSRIPPISPDFSGAHYRVLYTTPSL